MRDVALTQITASGLGGYIAGRLRIRWPGVPVDEVYFRDTARKAVRSSALWMFIALLMGAFFASLMAMCGGR